MNFLILISLIFTVIPFSFAQENDDIFSELQSIRDKKIEKVIEARKYSQNRRYTDTELFTLKITLEDVVKSELRSAFIEKGAVLIELSTGEVKYTPKELSVNAFAKVDRYGFRYIINKEGVPKYKVSIDNITDVEKITDLYREPKEFTRLAKKAPVKVYDTDLNYSLDFNFHTGISFTQFTKSIIEDASDYAALIRLELAANTNFDLPVDTGLALVYEGVSGDLENAGGSFSSRALSLGPNFQMTDILGSYDLKLQPRIAIISDLNERRDGKTTTHKLSDTSLLVALEKEVSWQTIGTFTLGYSFQRKWLKPKANSTGLNFNSSAEADDSFAIYVGHGTDFL